MSFSTLPRLAVTSTPLGRTSTPTQAHTASASRSGTRQGLSTIATPGSAKLRTGRGRPIKRALLTPGRNRDVRDKRRISGALARVTPRDDLRALSRLLRPSEKVLDETGAVWKRSRASSGSIAASTRSSLASIRSGASRSSDVGHTRSRTSLPQHDNDDDGNEDNDVFSIDPRLSQRSSFSVDKDDSTENITVEFARKMSKEPRLSMDRSMLSAYDAGGDTNSTRSSLPFVIRPYEGDEIVEYPDDPAYDYDNDIDEEADNLPLGSTFQIENISIRTSIAKKPKFTSTRKAKKPSSRDSILPSSLIKSLSKSMSTMPISSDSLSAIIETSDAYMKQLSADLGAYAQHASRQTINESDALMLFRRQRQMKKIDTLIGLSQKYLPGELLGELKLPTVDEED
ncbi:centromere kinetochore component CENP-T-domain-containing protein [Limtongia smithiae]|uniref:centromere kinetochore component CENP-T-domain-containing protein n=1 Tax=Limtongia smithiae TaxID=1125753 RepID=UPI0034CD3CA1